MTGQEFTEWLVKEKNCEIYPVEGSNVSGFSIKIHSKQTNRYFYFSGPFGRSQVPAQIIEDACDWLLLNYPLKAI